jgi:hypothetical protein
MLSEPHVIAAAVSAAAVALGYLLGAICDRWGGGQP